MALAFRCEDVGLVCGRKVTADSEEQLLDRIRKHALDDHDVELNQTLVDYARTQVVDAAARKPS